MGSPAQETEGDTPASLFMLPSSHRRAHNTTASASKDEGTQPPALCTAGGANCCQKTNATKPGSQQRLVSA